MRRFQITVRLLDQTIQYGAIAPSAADAYNAASEAMGEAAFGITVIPA
jgi:hypothetical protein